MCGWSSLKKKIKRKKIFFMLEIISLMDLRLRLYKVEEKKCLILKEKFLDCPKSKEKSTNYLS